MLYLGHFSFVEQAKGKKAAWHGAFTCVAEGKDVHDAVRKFDALITKLGETDEAFAGVGEIYLDSCVEVRSIPRAGFLAHLTLDEGEYTGGISRSLAGVTQKTAAAYYIGDEEAEDGEEHDVVPFVVLKKRGRARRAPGRTGAPAGGSKKTAAKRSR